MVNAYLVRILFLKSQHSSVSEIQLRSWVGLTVFVCAIRNVHVVESLFPIVSFYTYLIETSAHLNCAGHDDGDVHVPAESIKPFSFSHHRMSHKKGSIKLSAYGRMNQLSEVSLNVALC